MSCSLQNGNRGVHLAKVIITTFCLGYLVVEYWNYKIQGTKCVSQSPFSNLSDNLNQGEVAQMCWMLKNTWLIYCSFNPSHMFYISILFETPQNFFALFLKVSIRVTVSDFLIFSSKKIIFGEMKFCWWIFLARYLWDSILAFLSKHLEPRQ